MSNINVGLKPFQWSVITAARLKDWQINNKQVIYSEHNCILRVNQKSCVLLLPSNGLLSGQSFKIATEEELSDALVQAEASICNDIKTIMRFRDILRLEIPQLDMNVTAVVKPDGVYWHLGSLLLNVESYPTLSDIVRYVLADTGTEPEEFFGAFHEVAWERVLSEGMSDCIRFTEIGSKGDKYCWELYRRELALTIYTSPRHYRDAYVLCFSFEIKTFMYAVTIRKHVVEQQWDKLLSSGVAENFNSRFRVHSYATKTYDIELSLSARAKERGFWAEPVPKLHDEDGMNSLISVPKAKEKRLNASTLKAAIDELADKTRKVFPSFALLKWDTISLLVGKGDRWTIEEKNARLDFVNGLLSVSFQKSRRYSEPVALPSSLEFDAAFEAIWRAQAD